MKYDFNSSRTELVITVDEDELRSLRWFDDATIQSDVDMHEFLEPLFDNSPVVWTSGIATGDLTSAPMLAITDDNGRICERWAFMDYQVCSVLERLRDNGKVIFIGGKLT